MNIGTSKFPEALLGRYVWVKRYHSVDLILFETCKPSKNKGLLAQSSLFRYKLALTPGLLANQAPLPPIVRGQERVREWPKSRNSLSLQLKTRQVSPVGNR